MAHRNELHINQSGDPMGVSFSVYRTEKPGVTDQSLLVATVDEANTTHTAYQVIGERLVQDSSDPFTWYASKIYEEEPGYTLYVNGSKINPEYVTSYPNSRKFKLSDSYDMTSNIVTADYWFLASVFQDDQKPQPGIDYTGPVANAINPPVNFQMDYDFTNYVLNLSWGLDTTPKDFYYAVKATDKNGYISPLSDEQHVSLSVDPLTMRYVVEKAVTVEGPWFTGTIVSAPKWTDMDAAVGGHIPMELTVVNTGGRTAFLTLKNPWYNWESNWRASYFYRVYCLDDEGERGPAIPDLPFYKGINIKPATYVLRRKISNGTPATLDGTDAVTLMTWTEATLPPAATPQDTITFTDDALPSGIYCYTTYVIDEKGMVGQPFYTTVDMR